MNKNYAKNEVIFRQGDAAVCMYDIISGSVGIYANYGESSEKLLTTLTVGGIFGEMGMIENLPRSATAVALEDSTELGVITTEGIDSYFAECPEKAVAVMKHMSMRLRALTGDYLDACKTISEMNEESKTKSPGLIKRIEKYINDYANTQVRAFGNDIEISKQIWS